MPLGNQAAGLAATDVNFLARVQGQLLLSASNVLSEATNTQDHLIRVRLAKRIKANNVPLAQFAVDVAMQPGPQTAGSLAAVTDAQIQTATDALFNQWADTLIPGATDDCDVDEACADGAVNGE